MDLTLIMTIVYWLLFFAAMGGWLWVLMTAFRFNPLWGIGSLFLPLAIIPYVYIDIEEAKKPAIAFFTPLILGFLVMFLTPEREEIQPSQIPGLESIATIDESPITPVEKPDIDKILAESRAEEETIQTPEPEEDSLAEATPASGNEENISFAEDTADTTEEETISLADTADEEQMQVIDETPEVYVPPEEQPTSMQDVLPPTKVTVIGGSQKKDRYKQYRDWSQSQLLLSLHELKGVLLKFCLKSGMEREGVVEKVVDGEASLRQRHRTGYFDVIVAKKDIKSIKLPSPNGSLKNISCYGSG